MKLLDMFIEFGTKGAEKLTTAMDAIKVQADKVTQGINALGKQATIAFASASATIGGYVYAGMSASNMSERLGLQMQRLSLSIAGLFRPELEKVINLVQRAADWFHQLTEAQRANIARWVEASMVALGVAMVLPRVMAGVNMLISGIRALNAALVSTGWGAFIVAAGYVAAALISIGAGTMFFENGLKGVKSAIAPVMESAKSLASSFYGIIGPVMQLGKAIFEIFVAALKPIMALVETVASVLGPVIGVAIKGLAWIIENTLLPVIKTLGKAIEIALAPFKFIGGKIRDGWNYITGKPKSVGEDESRGPLAPKVGGPEDITAAFSRMNVAALNVTAGMVKKTPEEEAVDELRIIRGDQARIRAALESQRPAFVR